jgi:AraC family transcriptional regulator
MSPFHFHRVFKGMVGETPLELHRRLRLERAAWTLLNEDVQVTTLAFEAGYETHESFTRAFGDHYGLSPSELRARASVDPVGCARAFDFRLAARSGIHFQPGASAAPALPHIGGDDMMNVDIVNLGERRVGALRHVGPYNRISEAFARLGAIAGAPGLMIGIYHDDPETTPVAELRSDAAIAIADGAPIPAGLVEQRLPAGRYARAVHVGSYDKLGDAWARLMGEWLPRSGERVTDGVSFEIYKGPNETELYLGLAS